jgi:anti-sigma-K factor RskA
MRSTTLGPEHEQFRDLCAAYALGALDPPESAELEKHLSNGCDICSLEIAAHRETMTAMGRIVEERTPSPESATRLFQRIGLSTRPAGTTAPARRAGSAAGAFHRLSLAAALLLAVVSLVVALASRGHVADLKDQIAAFESATDPIVSIVDLRASPSAAGARIRVTFDPRNSKWSLFAHDLPSPPAGMVYQGWLLREGIAHDLGTFLPDPSGHGFASVPLPGDPAETRVQVTLEPEGGSDQPQGVVVFSDRGGAPEVE